MPQCPLCKGRGQIATGTINKVTMQCPQTGCNGGQIPDNYTSNSPNSAKAALINLLISAAVIAVVIYLIMR